MKRYNVPRLVFINKLDRLVSGWGAPAAVVALETAIAFTSGHSVTTLWPLSCLLLLVLWTHGVILTMLGANFLLCFHGVCCPPRAPTRGVSLPLPVRS
jgi:hypothetical protein